MNCDHTVYDVATNVALFKFLSVDCPQCRIKKQNEQIDKLFNMISSLSISKIKLTKELNKKNKQINCLHESIEKLEDTSITFINELLDYKDCLEEFCEKVEKGEIKSTKTYNEFKSVLELWSASE